MIGWPERFAQEERTPIVLGLARVALASLLLWNTRRLALELQHDGYFAEFFHLPLLPESWVPSASSYELLLGIKALGALLAILGLAPRVGLFAAAAIGLYMLACDRLQYHNNRYATHLLALLVAFTPCQHGYNLWARVRARAANALPRPWWTVRIAQAQVSTIYLASGLGKLFDDDWRGGLVMQLRFARASAGQVSELTGQLLRSSLFASAASKLAIATELFLALGLWSPRTRPLAWWLGIGFHLGIEASARVDLFSWLMLSAYLLFVTPELRTRTFAYDPESRLGRGLARILPWFDWLMRFRTVAESTVDGPRHAFCVIDRGGRARRGLAGIAALFRALPLLFPLWLPLLAAASIARRPRHPPRARDGCRALVA